MLGARIARSIRGFSARLRQILCNRTRSRELERFVALLLAQCFFGRALPCMLDLRIIAVSAYLCDFTLGLCIDFGESSREILSGRA